MQDYKNNLILKIAWNVMSVGCQYAITALSLLTLYKGTGNTASICLKLSLVSHNVFIIKIFLYVLLVSINSLMVNGYLWIPELHRASLPSKCNGYTTITISRVFGRNEGQQAKASLN
jgi:hypothetical protein